MEITTGEAIKSLIECLDHKNELSKMCLELLHKYEGAEAALIWEYSGNIEEDTENLKTEVESYRRRIYGTEGGEVE